MNEGFFFVWIIGDTFISIPMGYQFGMRFGFLTFGCLFLLGAMIARNKGN